VSPFIFNHRARPAARARQGRAASRARGGGERVLRGGRPAAAAVLGGRAGCMFILVQRAHFFEVERGLGPQVDRRLSRTRPSALLG